MRRLTRRESLGICAGALAGLALGGAGDGARAQIPAVGVEPPELAIEPGARLRVPRPVHFVPADEVLFLD